jgi:hypothetical protein
MIALKKTNFSKSDIDNSELILKFHRSSYKDQTNDKTPFKISNGAKKLKKEILNH